MSAITPPPDLGEIPPLHFSSYITLAMFCAVIFFMINPIQFPISFHIPVSLQLSRRRPIPERETESLSDHADRQREQTGLLWKDIFVWKQLSFILHIHEGSAPLIGVLILWLTTCIGWNEVSLGIVGTSSFRPFSIIVLVMALAYVSISLDVTGIFTAIAIWAAKKSGRSPRLFFLYFYLLSSVITVVASNDVVVLTLTPIIVYFAKLMRLNPFPYLIAEFHAANTWSAILLIGNPTNIIAAQLYGLDFFEYFQAMALPGILASITSFCLLYAVFSKDIPAHMDPPSLFPSAFSAIPDKFAAIFGCIVLITCLIMLSFASMLQIPVWAVPVVAAGFMLARDIIGDRINKPKALSRANNEPILLDNQHAKAEHEQTADLEARANPTSDMSHAVNRTNSETELVAMQSIDPAIDCDPKEELTLSQRQIQAGDIQSLFSRKEPPEPGSWTRILFDISPTMYEVMSRMPWKIGPFVLGMFILVEALSFTGWVEIISSLLAHMINAKEPTKQSLAGAIYAFAYISAFACSVMNNQPMTILFGRIIMSSRFTGTVHKSIVKSSVFGLVIGSNLGANLMFHAALAGMMWEKYLARHHIKVSPLRFALYGFMITPPVLAVACFVLWLQQ